MPIYDFQCKQCNEVFEVRATIHQKEAGLTPECPNCNSLDVRQLITAGLFLHGGGNMALSACGPNAGPGCCGSN
jgi:putative FmdB family regulatory protein